VHFWTFRLQPLQAPPSSGYCFLLRAGLASDSPLWAITDSSDFVHYSRSHQSLWAESSSCRLRPTKVQTALRTIHLLPVALRPVSPRRSYFQLPAGSSAREGLPPSCARLLPSARVRARSAALDVANPSDTTHVAICKPPLPSSALRNAHSNNGRHQSKRSTQNPLAHLDSARFWSARAKRRFGRSQPTPYNPSHNFANHDALVTETKHRTFQLAKARNPKAAAVTWSHDNAAHHTLL
jgi:hypothetical protein